MWVRNLVINEKRTLKQTQKCISQVSKCFFVFFDPHIFGPPSLGTLLRTQRQVHSDLRSFLFSMASLRHGLVQKLPVQAPITSILMAVLLSNFDCFCPRVPLPVESEQHQQV